MDRRRVHISPAIGINIMVQCSHDYVMPYEYVIADCDASLILKAASAVEEDVFSYT